MIQSRPTFVTDCSSFPAKLPFPSLSLSIELIGESVWKFSGEQELRVGEQRVQHPVRNWHDAPRIHLFKRHHRESGFQEQGREREEGAEESGETEGAVSKLYSPEDGEMGPT